MRLRNVTLLARAMRKTAELDRKGAHAFAAAGIVMCTRAFRGAKKAPAKNRVLAVSEVIDCGVRVVSTGHGVLRQQAGSSVHTLHGEDLAHDGALMRPRAPDMSLRNLHVRHFTTAKRLCNPFPLKWDKPPRGVSHFAYTGSMDVYDFDGTLYRGDSTADFLKWCLCRYPRIALTLPRTGLMAVGCFKLHIVEKTQFKGALYRFLRYVPDIRREVERFWKARSARIGGPCHPRAGDLVISAGPEFLLRDVCAKRGLALIASQVDPHTGRTLGPNCSNAQKVARFREAYPEGAIDDFYSDSRNDDHLARIAKRAFLVDLKANALQPWPEWDMPPGGLSHS